ncbi:HrpJ domain-containing protein [Acerihabitans arboris]|uniref:SepL/TyeA/HrpJ family type III secretion system gatekeeper n=1 Tax=Acerihabitans arboris TaxID=2691583 RepID=A0A845SF06_9GAMM|nr:HrpJ domain-containing protein [Acerihabitans arboris]NDL63390.1 SepL/TyeA/HrpJ family type III secretion system gatekeeper [Acerihabitans arboris]
MSKVPQSAPFNPGLGKSPAPPDESALPPAGGAVKSDAASFRSVLATADDAKEEIGMLFGEREEYKSKSLESREVNIRHLKGNRGAVERIQSLIGLYQLLDGQQQGRLEKQLVAIRQALMSGGGARPPAVGQLIDAADNDAARCDVLLGMTLTNAREKGDTRIAALAGEALEQLHQQRGREVNAGLNTAAAIAAFTSDPQVKQKMRAIYYESIVHQQSAYAMLDQLLAHFGQHFPAALRAFQRALADEIVALAPSITIRALQKIHTDLNQTVQISHLLAVSEQLLQRLRAKLPLTRINMGAVDLARQLLNYGNQGIYRDDFKHLGSKLVGNKPYPQSLLFNGLLTLVNQMPISLWRESKYRFAALAALRALNGQLGGNRAKASVPPRIRG